MKEPKKFITKQNRLVLLGLLTLARGHAQKFMECEKEAARLLGCEDENYADHFSDAIFDNRSIDEVLKSSKISVK